MPLNNKLQSLIEGGPQNKVSAGKVLLGLWPTFVSIIVAGIWTYLSYSEGKFANDFPDFKFQVYLFICWGFVGVVVGLNVGWKNHNAKLVWACVDIVWISTALLSLVTMLSPVEQQVMKWRADDEANTVVQEQTAIRNEVALGLKFACSQPQLSVNCVQWTDLQRALAAAKTTENWIDHLRIALPKVQATAWTKENLDSIVEARARLLKARGYESRARSILEKVDLGFPYLNVFVLIVALGLRAGRSGADLAKGWSEWLASFPKKVAWQKWWALRSSKGWTEWLASRPKRSKKAVFIPVSRTRSGGPEEKTYIREADINFVLQGEAPEDSVINLGSGASVQVEITVTDSLRGLADKFQSLVKAELRNEQGARAGDVLLNLDRVIAVDSKGQGFIVLFANGRRLHIADISEQDKPVIQKVLEPA